MLNEDFCDLYLRFKKEDLNRVLAALNFPERLTLQNGVVLRRDEIFLRGLYELATGYSQDSVCMFFGRNQPIQSFVMKFFINHVYDRFRHLVMKTDTSDPLEWWFRNGLMEESAELIEGNLGLDKTMSHLRSYLHQPSERERQWNRRMKSVRISIEWNYMRTATLFRYVGNQSKLKLLQSKRVSKVYTVCTILRNLYSCLHGNHTSEYFNYTVPENFLECYVSQINLING